MSPIRALSTHDYFFALTILTLLVKYRNDKKDLTLLFWTLASGTILTIVLGL